MRCSRCTSENVVFCLERHDNVCEDCGHAHGTETDSKSLRIFLSYGHDSNEELVQLIKSDLARRGQDVWFDKSEIRTGR